MGEAISQRPAGATASRCSAGSGRRHAPRPMPPSGASGRRHRRRGPRPALSDAALLAPMRADLARSPWTAWTGEGHRPRSGPGCGPSTAFGCRASACCGRCGSTPCSRATGPGDGPILPRMSAASSPRRRSRCGRPSRARPPWSPTARSGCSASLSTGRRTTRLAPGQARHPLRGHPGGRHSGAPVVRPARFRRRTRPCAAPRPRQQLHVGRLPEADQVQRHGAEPPLRRPLRRGEADREEPPSQPRRHACRPE